ncbi:8417_t:CDS:2 [Ambispora gerdemannii]|uniref:8417_t:CDS:1 n=1 Tax=Ambispora gerdemannii TaxID=144530 RepID=A0A9N9G1H8_9GLOM|nr:8417_t:CDS:2 [Ambispora gerdemannii]
MTHSYPTFLSTVPAFMTENTVLLLRLWPLIRDHVSIRREGTLVSNGGCCNREPHGQDIAFDSSRPFSSSSSKSVSSMDCVTDYMELLRLVSDKKLLLGVGVVASVYFISKSVHILRS